MRTAQNLIYIPVAVFLLCTGCAVEGTDFPAESGGNNGFNQGNNGFNNGNNGGNNGNNGFNNGNNGGNNGANNNLADVGGTDRGGCLDVPTREECELVDCLWLTPGCDEPASEFEPICHPSLACDSGEFDCPDGFACRAVTYDPCLPQDGAEECNACGADLVACLPVAGCAGLDSGACEEAGCRFLTPGCEEPALPEAGCFDAADCVADDDCGEGLTCQDTIYDPCAGEACDACGASARVCLP
jgi:hypothetical protein